MDGFSRYHPMVNIIFYITVLGLTMFQMQMGMIVISFICGAIYYFNLKGMSGIKYFGVIMAVFVVSSLINPVFSHRGATLIFYMFTGNPVTLESVIYGICAALLISSAFLWFATFNQVISEDKIMAVLGKVMPHVALLITMVARFVPKYIRQQKNVRQAGNDLGEKPGTFIKKIKKSGEVFSITMTWALETSVETADSMRARGYGATKRSNYNNYRISGRDFVAMIWIMSLFLMICFALFLGKANTYYYPYIRIKNSIPVYLMYGLLCLTPVVINVKEAAVWHRLK